MNSSVIVSTEDAEIEESMESEVEEAENIHVYNQVIADNGNFTATLLEIEAIYDEVWDEEKN